MNLKDGNIMKKMKTKLSADNLILIQRCMDVVDAQLEKLHWQICPYLPQDNFKKGANSLDTLRNIGKERTLIEKARTQLCVVFEEQFK